MTKAEEKDCLNTDPFAGDFGSPGDRVLKNKIGMARKAGTCHGCAQNIEPGESVRMMTALFEGNIRSYRWCALCCAAMAKSWKDAGMAWEARCAMRMKFDRAHNA